MMNLSVFKTIFIQTKKHIFHNASACELWTTAGVHLITQTVQLVYGSEFEWIKCVHVTRNCVF